MTPSKLDLRSTLTKKIDLKDGGGENATQMSDASERLIVQKMGYLQVTDVNVLSPFRTYICQHTFTLKSDNNVRRHLLHPKSQMSRNVLYNPAPPAVRWS